MRNTLKLTLLAAALVCGLSSYAQKLGYINRSELIMMMPERDSAEKKLQVYSNDLSTQLDAIQVEFNTKFQEYQKNSTTLSESVRQLKEKELQELQGRYQEFAQVAQQDLQKMEEQLMEPIVKRADEATAKVSKANGLLIVFDQASGAMAYFDEVNLTDVLPLVKTELGIK